MFLYVQMCWVSVWITAMVGIEYRIGGSSTNPCVDGNILMMFGWQPLRDGILVMQGRSEKGRHMEGGPQSAAEQKRLVHPIQR